MKDRFNLLLAILFMLAITASPIHAAKLKVPQQVQKERLVLMPLRIPEEEKALQGAMETALVEGLQQKYEVFSGEQVAQKARQIFMKESQAAKKECDETRCMQGIAEAFQSELIATANVTKKDGGYFLALSVQNIFDNLVVYSKSLPCKNCDSFQVVDKLKELSGVLAPVPVIAAPAVEAPQPKVNPNDPDGALWSEAQKGNTVEDYQVYLDSYPKGKYIPFAKARIKKIKEAAQTATEQQEQQTWDAAQAENSEASYGLYLKGYPNGRFAGFAKTHQNKLKTDVAAKEEADLWQKAGSSNDQAAVEAYLNKYPSGRYISQAAAKLKLLKEEAAIRARNYIVAKEEANLWQQADTSNDQATVEAYLNKYPSGRYIAAATAKLQAIKEYTPPVMVSIPGRNYELGKYEVTQKEWRDIMGSNPSHFSGCGDTCPVENVSWNDIREFLQKLNAKIGREYRLPSEAEWEYACYGGSQSEYCGGNGIEAMAWYVRNSNKTTHPVGQKQANGYGLYDMSGNVCEWMGNWYDSSQKYRVLRGGSWSNGLQGVRSAARNRYDAANRYSHDYGFRLARTLP